MWPKKRHPYLLFDNEGLERLRAAGDSGLHGRLLAHFRAVAARYVNGPPIVEPPEEEGPKGFLWWHITACYTCYEYRGALELLSFLAVLTGEPKYIDAGRRWLLALCEWKHWGACAAHEHDYPGAWLTAAAALSYDWLWPHLSDTEHGIVRDALTARIRKVYQCDPHGWGPHAMWTYPATGTAAVSVLWDHQEAPVWLNRLRSICRAYVDRAYTREGECANGISYFGMLMSEVALFMEAVRNATAEDDFTSPVWQAGINYSLHCWTGGNYARHWDREQSWDRSVNTLMFLMARKYRSNAAQWVAAHNEGLLVRPIKDDIGYWEYGDPSGVLNYVWYDPSVQPEVPPNTPQAAWFRGLGLVAMRSGWDDDAVCLSFKSGIRAAGHEPRAQNRFTIDACGQRLTTEFWSDYNTAVDGSDFDGTTEGFNVITIDGKNQAFPHCGGGSIHEHIANNQIGHIVEFVDLPSYAQVRGDARQAYDAECTCYEREIFYLRPLTFVVIDRVLTKAPAEIVWRIHTTGDITIEKNQVTIKLAKAVLRVTSFQPSDGNLRVANISDIWKRHQLEEHKYYKPYGVNLWRKANGGSAWPLTEAEWYQPQPILEITPKGRTDHGTFVTLLEVRPVDQDPPPARGEYRRQTLCISARSEQEVHTFYYGARGVSEPGLRSDAEVVVVGRNSSGRPTYASMHRGTRLDLDDRPVVEADREVTVALDLRAGKTRAHVIVFGEQAATVTVFFPPRVRRLLLNQTRSHDTTAGRQHTRKVALRLDPGDHEVAQL